MEISENSNNIQPEQEDNSCDNAAENIRLKKRIAELERIISEQSERLLTAKNYSRLLESEINDINNKSMVVQRTNAELKKKLLEAEKICTDLKTEFIVIYEDWLNHEYSNASNENYEYLQFVIKNIFLALEKSGIDFKRIDE